MIIEKTTTSTSIPEELVKRVKESWKKVFTAKRIESFEHKVFETKKFRDLRKKIKFNKMLTKLTTKEKLKEKEDVLYGPVWYYCNFYNNHC